MRPWLAFKGLICSTFTWTLLLEVCCYKSFATRTSRTLFAKKLLPPQLVAASLCHLGQRISYFRTIWCGHITIYHPSRNCQSSAYKSSAPVYVGWASTARCEHSNSLVVCIGAVDLKVCIKKASEAYVGRFAFENSHLKFPSEILHTKTVDPKLKIPQLFTEL